MSDNENKHIMPISKLYENEKRYKDMVYLRQPIDGVFHEYTWGDVMDKARRVATFLKAQGFNKGDRIAILSKNCAQWVIVDFGIMLAGMVSVPLYATQHTDDITFILNHAKCKAIFVGKLDTYENQKNAIPGAMMKIDFPYQVRADSDFLLSDIFEKYDPMLGEPMPHIDDLITIMYTSGTTGSPKGVMFTYAESTKLIPFVLQEIKQLGLSEHEHFISYLPLAHIAERGIMEGLSLVQKSDISFVESIDTFIDNLKEVRPTLFFAVPRIWSVFQIGILEKVPQKKLDVLLKIPLVSTLIKKKIRAGLGLDRCQLAISGAASISGSTLDWFEKLGINIREGYGATENSAYATINYPDDYRMGSVGKPRPGVKMKVDEHGELWVKSPGDMAGYYKESELTQELFDEQGYMSTGDMAHIDEDGYVSIIGRVKEQFKSAKGEYIIPVPIENKFAQNTDIEQCCLVGLGLNQPILLAYLSESARKKDRDEVEHALISTLESVDEHLQNYEKVSHILVVNDEWTPENNLLTPTQKVKRHAIAERYGPAVNDLQHKEQKIAWE